MRTSSTVKIILAFAVMLLVIAAQSRTTSRLRRENHDFRGTRERAEETDRDFRAATQNVASNELIIHSLSRRIDTLQSEAEQLRQELAQIKAVAIKANAAHSSAPWPDRLGPPSDAKVSTATERHMSESVRHKLSALSANLDSVHEAHFKIDDLSLRSSLSRQIANAGPDWLPSQPLPLSFSAAEQIGREELRKLIEDESIWELTEITLDRMQCPGREQTKWFYSLVFQPPGGWCSQPDSFRIPIALSGTPGTTGL